MPSLLPSADNDYAAPHDMSLGRAEWDAALTSIGARLRAAEAIRADFESLIAGGTGQALEVISANVAPQLAAVAAQLAQLQADTAAAQDVVAALLSGSMPASAVSETAERIWLTPTLKSGWDAKPTVAAMDAAIAAGVSGLLGGATPSALDTLHEIAAALGEDPNFAATLAISLGNRLRVDGDQGLSNGQKTQGRVNLGLGALSLLAALDDAAQISDGIVTFAKLAGAALASQPQAEAGLLNSVLMTPARTAQAIAALSPLVKLHDDAVPSPVAYVEHAVDFSTYAFAITVGLGLSATANGGLAAQPRSAGGAVGVLTYLSGASTSFTMAASVYSGIIAWSAAGPVLWSYASDGSTNAAASGADRIRIYPASGNLDAGRIVTYGVRL